MRLLDKREVDQKKATERRLEVEEGKKLAHKVDELRRLWAEEEPRIRQARDNLVAECQKDTDKAIARRKDAEREALYWEERKAEAMKPVDKLLEQAQVKEAVGEALYQGAKDHMFRAIRRHEEADRRHD